MSNKRMIGILLIIIYIAFISLGLPDSVFGTAWPAIYTEFGISVSLAGVVTFVVSACTIVSSMFSTRLIHRFGTGVVSVVSVMMTVAAMVGYSLSESVLWFCICAVPLGLGAGCIDAALNNYVALHYNASHMNFLHCAYGVGVTVSPYLMSIALSDDSNWRAGYHLVAIIQSLIAVLMLFTLPLWKKVKHEDTEAGDEEAKTVGLLELARLKKARATWLLFIAYCGVEITAGVWCSTYLVECRNMSVDKAALCVMVFYGGLALGRFFSGVAAGKLSAWNLIYIGYGVLAVSLVALLLVQSPLLSGIVIFLVGFGCAPIYPNVMHLTPIHFGRDVSQSMMGFQSAAAFVGSTFIPPFFGLLAQWIGVHIFPVFLIVLFGLLVWALFALVKGVKQDGAAGNAE